jgi:Small Multidrug Resistance protein
LLDFRLGSAQRRYPMAWTYLFIAGLLEIGWAIGLKYTEGFTRLMPSVLTILAMMASFALLAQALKAIPVIRHKEQTRSGWIQGTTILSRKSSTPKICR